MGRAWPPIYTSSHTMPMKRIGSFWKKTSLDGTAAGPLSSQGHIYALGRGLCILRLSEKNLIVRTEVTGRSFKGSFCLLNYMDI